jgi:Domain of unknown function (DUF4157)
MKERIGLQRKKVATPVIANPSLVSSEQQTKAAMSSGTAFSGHDLSRISPRYQAKLSIGQPGDKYEQEADSVADRVMAMSEPAQVQREALGEEEEELQMKPLAETISPLVQREELLEEEEELQMKQSSPNAQIATPDLESQLSSSKSGGSPLSDNVRSFMEPRFGVDFSHVQVHTDSGAVQMAEDVGAQAFAYGSDVYFGAGKSPGNNVLTAHELTHVVQQTGSVQRKYKDRIDSVTTSQSIIQKNSGSIGAYDVNLASPSNGQRLPENVSAKMGNSLGANFSDVRVHTDGQAEQLGALAFAVGSDLHFAQGKYDPASQHGQELIGHELTHVIQQRNGRVSAPVQAGGGNATVVQDPLLEAEADALGAQAAGSSGANTDLVQTATTAAGSNLMIQQKPIVQAFFPALFSGIGSALSSVTAAQAATVGATLLAGGSQVNAGTSVQPGTSGVQPVQLDNGWMSNVDKQKLNLIIQYRLINRYVEHWVATHPEAMTPNPAPQAGTPNAGGGISPPAPAPTPSTPAPSAPAPQPAGVAGAAASGGQVDAAILNAVSTEVQLQLEQDLNTNQKTSPDRDFIWSDSGSNEADSIGTVGAISFTEVRGTDLTELLTLKGEAAKIPNLDLPMKDTVVQISQFRGGRMVQSPEFSTGYGDDLAVNLDGAGPTYDQAGNNGHGKHTYSTAWRWDGNTTHLLVSISVYSGVGPLILEVSRQGTPKDYSGSRAMPWNWLG